MTRQDLVNKSIDKLNTVKEALELIEILEYDEWRTCMSGSLRTCSNIERKLYMGNMQDAHAEERRKRRTVEL